MLEQNNYFIVDIYVDNGIDSILVGLLNLKIDDYEEANLQYNNFLKYLNDASLMLILKDGKDRMLKYA